MGTKQKRKIARLTQRAAHLQQVCAFMSVSGEYLRDSYQEALDKIVQQRESIERLERENAILKSDPGEQTVSVDFNQFRQLLLSLPTHRVPTGTIFNIPIDPIGWMEPSEIEDIPERRKISFVSRIYMRSIGRNEMRFNAWMLLDKVAIIDNKVREG